MEHDEFCARSRPHNTMSACTCAIYAAVRASERRRIFDEINKDDSAAMAGALLAYDVLKPDIAREVGEEIIKAVNCYTGFNPSDSTGEQSFKLGVRSVVSTIRRLTGAR